MSGYERDKLMDAKYDDSELARDADEKIRTFQADAAREAGVFHHLIRLTILRHCLPMSLPKVTLGDEARRFQSRKQLPGKTPCCCLSLRQPGDWLAHSRISAASQRHRGHKTLNYESVPIEITKGFRPAEAFQISC